MYTASTAFLEALAEAGVDYLFCNFGSDHPAMIEALAEAARSGRRLPKVITCPNEMVALTAAQGHAQVSGKAQAVIVHVECGTQSLAGAVHNVSKGRVPVLIFAGASPFTQFGELPGSRNEFIQWIQDVHDQRGIVRGYMRYDAELRTGRNIKQMTWRALQFAQSDPKGPVYLMGAREVMEETLDPAAQAGLAVEDFAPIAPAALPQEAVHALLTDLAGARRPLIVTSYLGRNTQAVAELQRLVGPLGIGVIESVPNAVNLPHDDPMYLGCQWNEPRQNPHLAAADVVVVIDSDVPWIPTVSKPAPGAKIWHLDVDPLKQDMPLWSIPARRVFRVHAQTALAQLNAGLDRIGLDVARIGERRAHYVRAHEARKQALASAEAKPMGDRLTAEYVTACVRAHVDADTIILNEGITNYPVVVNHIAPTRAGQMLNSGGGNLGWTGGAAIGAKLADPAKTVIALTGDGSYMFSQPSTVHWMARHYDTPFLQVVFNNRGWRAPRYSMLAVHPQGEASRAADIGVAFDPPPDYAGIAAAAGGAYARQVRHPDEVEAAVAEALRVVKQDRRAAVLDVWLPHLMEG
ncbi:thiamine pyrophosphate-requiring protein [Phreatobacter oligotrophus]|jgi:acetolactate synthase-1/2/3 large subunit|uniref:Acetolactate synthase-1/2/3 large subunit n=1 Tax=Phreatobacter oligotrophus TaxID=1122261 RepID=A0A2T4ZGJ0_9HYPH|nr:thiamine pyrophosphate-requiring protein [Phreatobacter oligotrophus]PTM61003.1 acetolactate synthase-1/2/3 large subunit [Phreatobacter oligotrophus]